MCDREPKRWQERFPPEDDPAPFGTLGATDVTIWREAEARLLAKRIDELCGPGRPFAYGDCVLLLRATTHMGVYERALTDRGIDTHVLGGRGYWAQQQVADLRALPGRAGQPAGRAGAALGAGLAAGRAVAGHAGGAGHALQAQRPRGHLAGDDTRTTSCPA